VTLGAARAPKRTGRRPAGRTTAGSAADRGDRAIRGGGSGARPEGESGAPEPPSPRRRAAEGKPPGPLITAADTTVPAGTVPVVKARGITTVRVSPVRAGHESAPETLKGVPGAACHDPARPMLAYPVAEFEASPPSPGPGGTQEVAVAVCLSPTQTAGSWRSTRDLQSYREPPDLEIRRGSECCPGEAAHGLRAMGGGPDPCL